LKAINEELQNMKSLRVYQSVPFLPPSANLISSRWIFKYKRNSKGEITKRKTRLVAKSFTQRMGIDYHETFSPTLKYDSLRLITALSIHYGFNIEQIDINSAYLNATLDENIYMEPPEGHPDHNKNYWKLEKAIYGLKQSGKQWNEELNKYLINIGFSRLLSEPCIYVKKNKSKKVIGVLGIYVDDILIADDNSKINKT